MLDKQDETIAEIRDLRDDMVLSQKYLWLDPRGLDMLMKAEQKYPVCQESGLG